MSFANFLKETIARKLELRDEALERAESRDDAAMMANDIQVARTAHNKAKGLARLSGERLEATGYQANGAIGNANVHKSRKTDNLSESIASGTLKGAECKTLIPLFVKAAKGEGFISRTLLERPENGGYRNNYRTFWKPLEGQGALTAAYDGRSIIGYHVNPQNALAQNIVRVFG